MQNRLTLDIYWCALSATWCCKTFTIMHAQNIVVRKIFVRDEGGGCGRIPRIPPGSATDSCPSDLNMIQN